MATTIGRLAPHRAAANALHDADRSPRAVLIGQVLDALRFHGWFFCVSELSAPWALQLPGGRLAAVHAVLEGECVVSLVGEPAAVRLSTGDVVVLPRDETHAISDRPGRHATPVATIAGVDRRDRNATTLVYGGGGAHTQLLTASFAADMRMAQAVVAGLPAMIVLRSGTSACTRLAPVLALIRAEAEQAAGVSSAVLRRAAEVLFIQALREALFDATPAAGWLAAASDPRLAPALTALHAQPERRWTLPELAGLAHLSASVTTTLQPSPGHSSACSGGHPGSSVRRSSGSSSPELASQSPRGGRVSAGHGVGGCWPAQAAAAGYGASRRRRC